MSSSKLYPPLDLALDLPLAADVATTSAGLAGLQDQTIRLFDECAPGLRKYARSFGLEPDAAEDVVQEAFVSLFRHLRLGRSRHNLKGWLFRVAHNLALKQRQQLARRARHEDTLDAQRAESLADGESPPDERIAESQRRRRLRRVVAALPARDRHCLYLRSEGLRYRDIAAVLEISLGSVAKSLARALTRLMNADEG
jgi:RNA polymerase sigma-70 factor (ECF subfamily)